MKVLKIAAIVIGAAVLVATGVGAVAGLGLAAGVTSLAGLTGLTGLGATIFAGVLASAALYDVASLANLILPKPSQGGAQSKWKADPYAGLPYVMGRTLVGGNIIYRRGSGGTNDYEQFVTVLGIGPFKSIDTTFLNKTTVAFDGGGAAEGTYNGQVWQRSQLGQCPEPAALTAGAGATPGWTAQHKLSGLAATFLTFRYDTKSKVQLTTEPSPGWIIEGCMVWDPRLDSTYPGGVGPCRADQPATHVYSEDPHLHGLKWAIAAWQNGVRVAGIGVGSNVAGAIVRGVDVAPFVEGANLNTARNWKIGGQVVTRPDTLWNSLKAMLQAGGATPVINGGIVSCINRVPRVSLATITRSDIVGKCSLSGTPKRRARINGIIPQYRSEAHDWEMVSASEVSIAAYVALDGDERTKEVPYPLVQQVDQVAQLATYDICDAREAGPGTIPLKPWWLNYKIGDCVTFSPEDGFSLKVQITGRGIEAQSGVVSYDVRGETDGKHALALGQTGIAPPIASLIYDMGVPAPAAGDWALAGTALTAAGASIPALHISGAVGNTSADAVVFEYRQDGSADWMAGGTEVPATTDKVITSITPGTTYDVAVSYRIRGVVGDRLVLGPVTAGLLSTARASFTLRSQSVSYPLTSADTTIGIAAFTGTLDDGTAYAFQAGTITGLTGGQTYGVFVNRASGAYFAAVAPAQIATASAENIFVGWQATSSSGSYPSADPPPGGYRRGTSGQQLQ